MGKGPWSRWLHRKPPPPRLLDLQEFREYVAGALARRYPSGELDQFGDDGIWLSLGKSKGNFNFNVARYHALYCETPANLEPLVAQLADIPARKKDAATKDSLRVLVRPETYLTVVEAKADQLCRHIAGSLWAIVATDEGDAIGFPSATDLQRDLGLEDAAIWDQALANTRNRWAPIRLPAPKAVQIYAVEDGYASSYLADDELWRRLDDETTEGVLAVPLELNVLCLVGSFSPDAAPVLRELIAISEASANHLSSVALTRRNGEWLEAAELDRAFAPSRVKH